ncbi:Histone-lysine N-methyltransferase family protein [Hibiscus syriacus]|uniref:Histone-lysine N-methyltransferase family protein n=1 Tax=Hibiscus syriacus TaxID=106335 RepID=A0A6A2YMD6_HIBSY|nr:Histone-lysine N-methyltransferase family protein [Hibiscus syriacus]
MVVLTTLILVFPLVMPELPPPPLIFLWVPVLLMSILLFLALSPAESPNIGMSSVSARTPLPVTSWKTLVKLKQPKQLSSAKALNTNRLEYCLGTTADIKAGCSVFFTDPSPGSTLTLPFDQPQHSLLGWHVVLVHFAAFAGSAINFSNLPRTETYPLAYGKDIAAKYSSISGARSCYPGSLDPAKVKGEVIVCLDSFPVVSRETKKLVAEDAGSKGLILIDENDRSAPFDSGPFPFAEVGSTIGSSTSTLTNEIPRHKPEPVMAYFHQEPDIMAPGVAILAAVIPKVEEGSTSICKKPPGYAIKSGTSMACPHVTGASAS